MGGKKKNKKALIIILIVVFLLLIGLLLFFVLKGDDKVTVTFDSDGGTPVAAQKIKKGGTITIPESTKEGYVLDGWYKDDQKVTSKTYIFTDATLKAKWTTEAPKTYTITFDSKGGSEVEKLVVECEKEIKFGPAPTKEGYTFVSWVDKNETPILDGALLTCEDVTLYANWEKKAEETKYYTVTFDSKGGSKVNPIKVDCSKTLTLPANPTRTGYKFVSWYDKNGKTILTGAKLTCEDITLYADWKAEEPETPKKEYKCPEGYELKDTKCYSYKSGEYSCPEGFTNSTVDNTVCYKYNKEPDKVECKNSGYHYVDNGTHFCGYEELASYTGNRTMCQGAGGIYVQSNSHCFKKIEPSTTNNSNYTCYGTYAYRTKAQLGSTKDGCYELKQRNYGCSEGYTMNHSIGKCVKTVDATYE